MYSLDTTLRALGRVMARYAQDKVGDFDANATIEAAPLLKVWVAGTMENPVMYTVGDVRTYENQPWKCAQSHTHHGEAGWDPIASRNLWSPYHSQKREYALPYVQPTAAHDSYQNGEWMIWTDGNYYECIGNAVVHAPDVYPQGWRIYSEPNE